MKSAPSGASSTSANLGSMNGSLWALDSCPSCCLEWVVHIDGNAEANTVGECKKLPSHLTMQHDFISGSVVVSRSRSTLSGEHGSPEIRYWSAYEAVGWRATAMTVRLSACSAAVSNECSSISDGFLTSRKSSMAGVRD